MATRSRTSAERMETRQALLGGSVGYPLEGVASAPEPEPPTVPDQGQNTEEWKVKSSYRGKTLGTDKQYFDRLIEQGHDRSTALMMTEGRPRSEEATSVLRVPQNIAEGFVQAVASTADEVLTDPGEWWGRHWAKHDKFTQKTLKDGQEIPLVGFAKNTVKGVVNLVTFPLQVAYAVAAAADESPEEAAKVFGDMAGGIAAGTAYVFRHPVDSFEADAVGSLATVWGFTALAKAKSPAIIARARKNMEKTSPGMLKEFDNFIDNSAAAFAKLKDIPINPVIGGRKFGTEKRGKTVRERSLKDDFGITGGADPLTLGNVISAGAKSGALGYLAGGVPASVVSMLGYTSFSVLSTMIRANKGALANKTIGLVDRFIRTTSAAGDMAGEAAVAAILSAAAKADGALASELRNINHLARNGDYAAAVSRLGDLTTNKDIIGEVIESNIGYGKTGNVVDSVTKARSKESTRYRELHPEMKESVDAALGIIDAVLGADKVSPGVRRRIDAVANLDSLVFGGLEPLRHQLRLRIERRIGRALKSSEVDLIHKRSEQFATLGHLSSGKLSGRIVIGGQKFELRTEYNNILSSMKKKDVNKAVGTILVETIATHRGEMRAKAFSDALAADAHRILSPRTREMMSKTPADKSGYSPRDILESFVDDLVLGVVGKGDATPMSFPQGISMKAVATIIARDPVAFAKRAMEGIAPGDPVKLQQATRRTESLIRELNDSGEYNGRRVVNDLDAALKDTEATMAFLEDLRAEGADVAGIRDALAVQKRLSELQGSNNNVSMRTSLVDTLGWLRDFTLDSSQWARLANTAKSGLKTGLTAMTVGVNIGNGLANVLLTASDRGVGMFRALFDDLLTGAQLFSHSKGRRGNLTKDDNRIFGMISDMGFKMGDVTSVEMLNFLRSTDLKGLFSGRRATRVKNAIADTIPGRFIEGWGRLAKEVYSWGDTVPKANEAYHSILFLEKKFVDLEKGRWMDVETHRGLFRRVSRGDDGALYVAGKRATDKQIRDITMAYARRRANERFKDFQARPGFLRALDSSGLGLLASTFMTWQSKAKGVGDQGLGTLIVRADKGIKTNDPKILAQMYTDSAKLQARRAMIIQASKQYSDDNTEALGKLASRFGNAVGLLFVTESENPTNLNVRNLNGVASVVPEGDLKIAAARILSNFFYDDKGNQIRRASEGVVKSDSNIMESIITAFDVLGWGGGIGQQLSALLDKDSTGYERGRAKEFFGRGLAGGSVYDIVTYLTELAERAGLPVEVDTLYDRLKRDVPGEKLRSLTDQLFNRLGGPLGSKDFSMAVEMEGPYKSVWKEQVYAKGNQRVRMNIKKNFWDPVAKKYGPKSEEAHEAYKVAKDWYHKKLTRINLGYHKVFGKYPERALIEKVLMSRELKQNWMNNFRGELE